MRSKYKKGFTIIELIVVIAVIGVLVLLALPKFFGYTEKAKVSEVKSDIVAYEKAIDTKRIDDDKYIKDWEKVDVPTMESLKKSLFNKKGLINDSNNITFEGEYYKIPKDNKLVKTNLKGDFYLGQGGEVYYYDEKLASKVNGGSSTSEPPVVEPEPEPIETFNVTFKDYYGDVIETKTVKKGQEVIPPVNPVTGLKIDKWDKDLSNITSDLEVKPLLDGPTDKELKYVNSDFTWVEDSSGYIGLNGETGYFKYTGADRAVVEIPHVIQGVPMTSYYKMFFEAPNAEITKVVSTNKNITNMSWMFSGSQATTLDLSNFDTSKVENMSSMFESTVAVSLNVSNFNTSNVKNMQNMFNVSKATDLNVLNFDTSKVENMSGMFRYCKTVNLNISKFNTSNVKNMSEMFLGAHSTSLNFNSFDTSKVEDMSYMFSTSKLTSLDLSSFNMSNVTNTDYMFFFVQVTTGYGKTLADVNKLNKTIGKPTGLTFKVK